MGFWHTLSFLQGEADTVSWEWHRYKPIAANELSNQQSNKGGLLIVQYSGSSYNELLESTSVVNRAYAKRYGYNYVILRGVALSVPFLDSMVKPPPSRTTYNKISILQEFVASRNYDRLLLLDADALIRDFATNLGDFPFETVFVAHNVIKNRPDPSNVNIGVTLWNLHHADLPWLIRRWKQQSILRILRRLKDDDQRVLQAILRRQSVFKRNRLVLATDDLFGYDNGKYVQHFIRRSSKSWDAAPKNKRLELVQATARDICQRYAPSCDQLDP
jgi:hypothetical protein